MTRSRVCVTNAPLLPRRSGKAGKDKWRRLSGECKQSRPARADTLSTRATVGFGACGLVAGQHSNGLSGHRMKRHGINPAAGVDVLAETIRDDEYGHDEVENSYQQQPQKPKVDSWETEWDSSDWGESGGDPTVAGSSSVGWEEEVQWSTDLSQPATSAGSSTKA